MGCDNLVKTRRLFEDEKQEDISFAEVSKKRNEIMNGITSSETPKQKISVSKFYKGDNGVMSNQAPANAIIPGEYLI